MLSRTFLLATLATTLHQASAQRNIIDRRDQADGWYLPVECNVTAQGGSTELVQVALYKDNELVIELQPEKKMSSFMLELDIDNYYTIVVSKDGYRQKTVWLDTHLPENQVKYDKYPCNVNLEPLDKFAHSDKFYLDFPSALVRWNDERKAFAHNDDYLTNIQVKMALLGAQLD